MYSPLTAAESARAAGKALTHAVRRGFIHQLMAANRPLPASALADARDLPLSLVTYHARFLVSLGVIEIAETVQRPGGIESRYRLGGPSCQQALTMLPVVERLAAADEL